MKNKPFLGGFTLIELLIVVAIIAILAAIAVPNFLEAQVRAKVSRVKADQRTVATAIESYAVDWNDPPIGYSESQDWYRPPGAKNGNYWIFPGLGEVNYPACWMRMTTPIAYISSVPIDPFCTAGIMNPNGPNYMEWSKYYRYESLRTHIRSGLGREMRGHYKTAAIKGSSWSLASLGPLKSMRWRNATGKNALCQVPRYLAKIPSDVNSWGYPDALYDATNGTISTGWVFRSSQGIP